MRNVSDLLKRLEAQSHEELTLFEAQTRSALSNWHESLRRSLSQSLATIEADMGKWAGAVRDRQRRHIRQFQRNWTLLTVALAAGLLLGGFVGMTEIARSMVPKVPTTVISGRLYVLVDRTSVSYAAHDPKSLWVAAAQ